MKFKLKNFFLPPLTRGYLIRVFGLTVFGLLFFSFICLPFRVKGRSMEPTYMNGEFNFCFRPRYLFSKPERQDVVVIRLAGEKVMLLKRVVALEGETVEFKNGRLWVNGEKIDETYIQRASEWKLPPRRVKKRHVYVVGDNRNVPMAIHRFGQTSINRIIGVPLW